MCQLGGEGGKDVHLLGCKREVVAVRSSTYGFFD